ncbi:MAG: electron transfer flavoprotein subunit beta/FixA family protein [Chloroflexi bacterium]|nr:electron transfer flavoprotein subunit beta/FixA family protein [Chloroflexota bacterium]
MPLHLICCAKQVPDPETPAASFRIDPAAKKVVPAPGIAPVISPFDEQAVEVALRIKDKRPDTKVTIVSLGGASARDVVKHGLAMGADEGILLEDPTFENVDAFQTAYVLSLAVKKVGQFDAIFCGRQAADFDQGQVAIGLAELLGIPALINGQSADFITDNRVTFERVLPDGIGVFEANTPVLTSYSQEVGQPRYPTLRNIMTAARKEISVWKAADLGVNGAAFAPKTRLVDLYVPTYEGACEIIEADSPAEAGEKLALKLREAKII